MKETNSGAKVVGVEVFRQNSGIRKPTLLPSNTVLRRFEQGEGMYNHCVIQTDGIDKVFIPTAEFMDDLEEMGFPIEEAERPDQRTEELLLELQSEQAVTDINA